jgi:deoxyribonuclease-2
VHALSLNVSIYGDNNLLDYNWFLEFLPRTYTELEKADKTQFVKHPPFFNIEHLVSSGGVQFTSFAKSRNFKKEIYEDWVAPILNDDIYVESWRNGRGNIGSNCTKKTK